MKITVLAAVVVALSVVPLARPAHADSITIVPDITVANLTEGQTLVVHYTATIFVSPGASLQFGSLSSEEAEGRINPSGDGTDLLSNGGSDLPGCQGLYSSVGNGTSANVCTLTIAYSPLAPSTDTSPEDSDSGTATARFFLFGFSPGTGLLSVTGTADTLYTVTDVGAPESGTLLMFASGLIGVALRRRRP